MLVRSSSKMIWKRKTKMRNIMKRRKDNGTMIWKDLIS
jgi:hypothetical protein